MGFSGGGTNILKPHKHTSAVQDGSPLNMDNVTEGSLTAGDVVYSDGAALQRLAIGNVADKLEVNPAGTAPQWAPGAAGAVWTSIYDEFDFDASLDTGHQSSWSDYRYIQLFLTGQTTTSGTIQLRIYDPDGNEYSASEYFTYGHRSAPGPDLDWFGNGNVPPTFSATSQLDLTGGLSQYTNKQWSLFLQLQMLSPNAPPGSVENALTGYYSLMSTVSSIMGTFAIERSGITSTDSQMCQGFKLISPSTNQTGCVCQVFGAGNSTA
jgi:hypothetical protein